MNSSESKFSQEIRKRKGKWLVCATCGKDFYAYPSRLKKGQVKYCSMKCYEKEGEKNPFWGKKHNIGSIAKMSTHPNRPKFTSENNPDKVRYGESFVGKSYDWWKRWFIRNIGKCEICSMTDVRILEIHHKNKNRKDNKRDNLLYVCPNCHALIHYKEKIGWEFILKTGRRHRRDGSISLLQERFDKENGIICGGY
jgi:hypothetical protein